MKEPAGSAHTTSVPAALLDYFEAPGNYQLTLRQPAVLFGSIREILQLASGRGPVDAPQSSRLREAANFFIRAALLYPGADHYAVLGLAPGEAVVDLKERYRLLMRLIHPDFAAGASVAWPDDAAVRVNRAYEVLSSGVLRREYDEQLAASRPRRQAATPAEGAVRHRAVVTRPATSQQRRLGRRAAWILAAAAIIPVGFLLLPGGEPVHLVQRPGAQKPAVSAAAAPDLPERSVASEAQADPAGTAAPPTVSASTGLPSSELAESRPEARPVDALEALPKSASARPAVPASASTLAALERSAPLQPASRAVAPAPPSVNPGPSPQPPPVEPPRLLVAPEPAIAMPASLPIPAATTVATVVPVGRLTTTLALPSVPVPTLNDAQPLLTQILQMLESGSGDQLLRLLDSDARKQAGAQALSRKYEQIVKEGRPIRLSQVDFSAEPGDGVLLVTGRIRLHAGEPTIGSFGQKLVLKAEFVQRGGKTQLTGMSSAPD